MTTDRERRASELLAERDAAYQEYRALLGPDTTPLGLEPREPKNPDREAVKRAKARYEAAKAALDDFQRGSTG
jgi:hypothetical protein